MYKRLRKYADGSSAIRDVAIGCYPFYFIFFSRVSLEGAGSKALLNAIDKQRAAERDSLALPQGADRRGCRRRAHKGTRLAFALRCLCSANPVPFDPALYSDRSEHLCLASLMHIILPGQ